MVQPSLLFTDRLREKIDYVVNDLKIPEFTMYVHPYVDAYIKKGLLTSIYKKWRGEFGRKFKIVPNQALAYLEYRIYDKNRKEIDVKESKDLNVSSDEKKASKSNRSSKED